MNQQIDSAIQSRVVEIGLEAYVSKLKTDTEKSLQLRQETPEQVERKLRIIVSTLMFVERVLARPDIESYSDDLKEMRERLAGAVGRKSVVAPAAGGRRKMSRTYCKKTPCKKMGFSQRASCRPYKNCFTRRARRG